MLGFFDWIVLGVYFSAIVGIAWWALKQKTESSTDYFLAGRNVGWFVIGASIFASNIGSEHVVGLAGTAASSGLVLGHYELHSWLVLLLGWVFVPFYMRSQVFTMPEFLELRYGSSARWFLSIIMLFSYVLTKISVTIYAGAVVFQVLMGIEFWTGALIVVLLTGCYTVLGGLRVVLYTEALQAIVLIAASVAITTIGLIEIGGPGELVAMVGPDKLNMFLPADHPEFPWTGMVFAPPIVGLWYWCTDQYIVQRVIAGRNETEARRGTIFAGYLKLLPFFIFMVPGLVAFALAESGRLHLAEADQAFPALVAALLPVGLRGLVAGGLLAALMSSLAAVFNSSSTIFTIDIYKKLRPETSDRSLVLIGRVATAALVLLGILWIPFLRGLSGELYHYIQSVSAYIAPPIAAVFLFGVFWKRINGSGAIVTLVGGFVIGMLRLVAEINSDALNGFPLWFAEVNFLHFAVLLFVVCTGLLVGISLLTTAPEVAAIRGLTYGTTVVEDRLSSRKTWGRSEVIHSLIIVGVILFILITFSPIGVGR